MQWKNKSINALNHGRKLLISGAVQTFNSMIISLFFASVNFFLLVRTCYGSAQGRKLSLQPSIHSTLAKLTSYEATYHERIPVLLVCNTRLVPDLVTKVTT